MEAADKTPWEKPVHFGGGGGFWACGGVSKVPSSLAQGLFAADFPALTANKGHIWCWDEKQTEDVSSHVQIDARRSALRLEPRLLQPKHRPTLLGDSAFLLMFLTWDVTIFSCFVLSQLASDKMQWSEIPHVLNLSKNVQFDQNVGH